jgi:hypothetical protein
MPPKPFDVDDSDESDNDDSVACKLVGDMGYTELQRECKRRRIKATGSKEAIQQRLINARKSPSTEAVAPPTTSESGHIVVKFCYRRH